MDVACNRYILLPVVVPNMVKSLTGFENSCSAHSDAPSPLQAAYAVLLIVIIIHNLKLVNEIVRLF